MKYSRLKKIIQYYPFLVLIPFNLAFYIPGLPIINIQRIINLLLIFSWFAFFNPVEGTKRIFFNYISVLLFIAFFIIPFISYILNYSELMKGQALFGERYLFVPFFFAVGYHFINEEKSISRFCRSILISLFILNIFAVIQYLTNYDFFYTIIHYISNIPEKFYESYSISENFEERASLSRIKGTFFHPISFGVYIASFLTIYFISLRNKAILRNRILILAGIILSFTGLFITVSRTPLFLVLMVFILLWMLLYFRVYLLLFAIPSFWICWLIYDYFTKIGFGITADSARTVIFNEFLDYFSKIPLFGIGPGMFSSITNPKLYLQFSVIDPMAYNLTAIIEYGLLYGFFFILIVVGFFRNYLKRKSINLSSGFLITYSTYIFALFISAVFVSVISISPFNCDNIGSSLFWILMGSGYSLNEQSYI